MKNINIRVMDYVVLVQSQKINMDSVPEDIKTDVIELVAYFQNGEVAKKEEAVKDED